MSALAIRCPLCGSDNLFPAKYAGRTLSCSHCGESLPVVSSEDPQDLPPAQASGVTQVAAESKPRATGLRRLTKAFCHGLCILCFLVMGLIGGGWAGIALASKAAIGGSVLAVITCPIGAFIGLWLARWIGSGTGELMGSYRLSLPGMLAGMASGVFYWVSSNENSYSRLMAGQLVLSEWLAVSLFVAAGGLLLGFCSMIIDAIFNITP